MEAKSKVNYSFIFMGMVIVFALFTTIKVATHSIFWMDDKIAGLFSHVPHSVIPFFIQLTEMGDKKGIGVVAILMLIWLLVKKRNYLGAAVFALSIALGNEISKLLKDYFARPRPDLEHLVDVKSYSFPSGHAMVGMTVYFLIAYLLIESAVSKKAKIIIGACAAILLLLIGASRIILHVHYPSDVLGGYALGYIWVSLSIILYNYLKKKKIK
ncbi:phosphatase PAP2 family protein [Neobacillus drentensis]|uniref:phosphatase PAP2 family protein n=1 Tax=Neobacillus drentensis TaxID=220684 RepID=UPI0030005F6A